MEDGKVVFKTELETKDFDREIRHVEQELQGLEEEYETVKKAKPFEGQQEYLEKLSKQILKTKKNLNSLVIEKEKFEKSKLTNFESSLGSVGNSISNIISKVGKWALAIFSVRTAYSFIRNSVSTLSQYNEKMANDIEYIRYALASTLQPIIEKVIDMVYRLLQYINYISNAWFGKNIFENANKNLKNANKSANQLKKTLAGFDEVNILSSNKSTSSVYSPSVDLSKQLGEQEVPKWLQWIADHKDLIKKFTEEVLILFGAVTAGKILKSIASIMGTTGSVGLIGLKGILTALAVTWVITLAIKDYEKVKKQVEEINETLDENTNQMNKNKNTTQKVISEYEKLIKTGNATNEQLQNYQIFLKDSTERALQFIDTLEGQKNWLGAITGENKKLSEQQQIQREKIVELMNAYSNLYNQGKLDNEQQKTYKNLLEKTMDALADQGVEVNNLKSDYEKLTKKDYTITIKAKADTKQADKDYSNFFSKLGESVGVVLNPTQWGSGFGNKLKSIWSGKKYAKGGIINLPGQGVALPGGIGGERGYEGIVPLTDTAQMQMLGESIGKFVTINLTNVTELDGRTIARKVSEVNNNTNFLLNR